MNKEELLEYFEKNVLWLKNNVPPDDIYLFAEQTFMAAVYFLKKWSDNIDLEEEMKKNPISKRWVTNIISLQCYREENESVNINLNIPEE